jgi:hypothetical protein
MILLVSESSRPHTTCGFANRDKIFSGTHGRDPPRQGKEPGFDLLSEGGNTEQYHYSDERDDHPVLDDVLPGFPPCECE